MKRLLGGEVRQFAAVVAVVLLVAATSQAGVILEGTSANGGSNTVVHSTTADTDLLLVGYGIFGNDSISGVTFDDGFVSQGMTPVPDSLSVDARLEVQFFYILNPGAVSDATITGSAEGGFNKAIVAYNIQGVTATDQVSAVTSTQGDEDVSSWSTNVTSSGAGLIIDLISTDDLDGLTADAGQTVTVNNNNSGDRDIASSYKSVDSAGTYSMGWTGTDTLTDNEGVAHSVLAITPEPATLALVALGLGGTLLRRRRR